MAERVQSVVVGAGVVGLAVSRALARRGREVLLVEALPQIGSATSSRNSGVVHAGIYYPQGSLKATTCVQGRKALYRFCEEEGVAHARCGKLILATSQAQISSLQGIATKAKANGVVGSDELLLLTAEEAREKEPLVSCCGALFSPSTGIVDVHEFMLALLGSAEAHGASLALSTPVVGGSTEGGLRLLTPGLELQCDQIVNCAGHGAPGLARQLGVSAPVQHWAKGNYFSLQGASPFTHLIYPLPSEAGLGIHATLDLAGRCRFGPDVEWLLPQPGGELDYQVDPARAEKFYSEVRKYWPALPDGSLTADYSGVRPKIQVCLKYLPFSSARHQSLQWWQAPGEAAKDFLVQSEADHGVSGLVNLFGIESPGLTASLALGEYVASLLCEDAR